MKLIAPTVCGLAVLSAGLLPSCKDRGEVERETLSEAGYEVGQEAFFRAAESDDVRAMKAMVDAGLPLDSKDPKDRTALHAAAGSGAVASMNFLLDRRMEIDVADEDRRTPLMEAVLRSTPETVRFLLRQGADPSRKDHEKYKPLMLAVRDARSNMVPELAPYVRDDLDDALLAASILGQAGVIDELTNFGASIYARIDDGRTPLMLAAQNGHTEAVEILLEIGANRFATDQQGRSPADLAAESGHDLLAERLADQPEEGDFELSEPAELGAEMLAMVEARIGGDGVSADAADAEDRGESVPDGETPEEGGPLVAGSGDAGVSDNGAVAETDGGSSAPQPGSASPAPLEGAVLAASIPDGSEPADTAVPASTGPESVREPIIMRSYRQRELPLVLESADAGVAEVRIAGGETRKIGEGSVIPGTSLKVVRVERRMQSGKEAGGEEVEVSVVAIEDTDSGASRDLVADLPALAHDPVALVEDSASGKYYVARTGQRFKSADGADFLVGDVRPNQIVIENMATGRTTTIPLRGPRG